MDGDRNRLTDITQAVRAGGPRTPRGRPSFGRPFARAGRNAACLCHPHAGSLPPRLRRPRRTARSACSRRSRCEWTSEGTGRIRPEFRVSEQSPTSWLARAGGRLAERVGFEPTVEFPLHTLSKRAPSTTRTSLRRDPRRAVYARRGGG